MSEQDKRAEEVWAKVNAAYSAKEKKSAKEAMNAVFAVLVAALAQARREGVEAILRELDTWADVAFATEDEHPKYIVGFMTAVGSVKRMIPRLRARLLAKEEGR